MARILAAKPHSADVERLISASNVLKALGDQQYVLQQKILLLFTH